MTEPTPYERFQMEMYGSILEADELEEFENLHYEHEREMRRLQDEEDRRLMELEWD